MGGAQNRALECCQPLGVVAFHRIAFGILSEKGCGPDLCMLWDGGALWSLAYQSTFSHRACGYLIGRNRKRPRCAVRYVGGASLASLDRTVFGDHDSHQCDWLYVCDSRLYSRARRRRCLDAGVSGRIDCSICEAFSRIVTMDICRRRRCSALFQCAGFDCPVVPKSANVEYACADAIRTAIPGRAGCGTDGFPISRHCRGVQISPGTSHCGTLTPEQARSARDDGFQKEEAAVTGGFSEFRRRVAVSPQARSRPR
jgi:hypothetical protein